MSYRITPQPGYLRADLLARETAQQTSEFLEALADAALKHRVTRILINVHASRPIFKVEQYSASAYLKEIALRPWLKVALVASLADVRSAHEYVELLARQQGANLRSFADDAAALAWLQGADQSQEKR
jgi:hypothetical protein